MSKEKLTNQLKNAYKQLEEEFKNKGRPNTIEDNNVDYDNCNIYAMRQKISDLEAKLAECEKKHLLDEREWQNYRAYKYIEPYIKGCLDREWQYEKEIDQLKQQLAEKEQIIEANKVKIKSLHKQIAELKKQFKKVRKLTAYKVIERVVDLSIFDFKIYEEYRIERYRITKKTLDNILKEFKE